MKSPPPTGSSATFQSAMAVTVQKEGNVISCWPGPRDILNHYLLPWRPRRLAFWGRGKAKDCLAHIHMLYVSHRNDPIVSAEERAEHSTLSGSRRRRGGGLGGRSLGPIYNSKT